MCVLACVRAWVRACVCVHACASCTQLCVNPCRCVHYALAFVKLWMAFSILMYFMCVMFVQQSKPWGRLFTNLHYYYY